MKGAALPNPGTSATAIQKHYDVGNEFYRLWLDCDLNYSAAMWEAGDSLDSAQVRKVEFHIQQSRAEGASCVLDVGCGWGAVLRRLVGHHGVQRAVGLTLSKAQSEWITLLRIPQVQVHVESWSDHEPEEPYDAIISIGAFEHLARFEASEVEKVEGYRSFFERCREWLKPQGRISLQTFAYGGVRSREQVKNSLGAQFLSSRIFTETDPPKLTNIAQAVEGLFEVVALRNDRKDYAQTCREWIRRLRSNRQSAVAIAGESVFKDYLRYLQLATIGFETGQLALYRISLAPLR